jgi:DNA-binding CsgD family transcriptional regulator
VIEPAVVRAREFGAPWALGSALRAAGTIQQGHAGIETLREAVAILEASNCRLEHAEAQLELGAALRRSNQRLEAQQHLRAALDRFHRNGALPSATRAADELAATGARPRRAVLRGLEALTASELRVARLAADGHTNREIAQALFVTTKTIDAHLNHTYTKLDINSRKQLAQALQVDRG